MDVDAGTPEVAQLEVAIAAIEGQRLQLGDAVVATAVAPMRAELRRLQSGSRSRRRQVTVMFADLSGYTTLSEHLDPEQVASMLSSFWSHVDRVIEEHRGRVFSHMGDGAMAVWGADVSEEDDAEKAVDAALAIIDLVAEEGVVVAGTRIDAQVSIGINTGLGHLVDLQDATVVGDSVNVAARLESAADAGTVLISRSTFHQVRGIFDVADVGSLDLKGRAEGVQAYQILRRRPRSFHRPTRGVEGVETAMVGRDRELRSITDRHHATLTEFEACVSIVVGEPGSGKSRLLHEAYDWLETAGIKVRYFEGRCRPDHPDRAFSLLRSILSHRFEISDNDSVETAFDKLATGLAGLMGDAVDAVSMAHNIGGLAGFGHTTATVTRAAAVADVLDLFRSFPSAELPAVLVLEDLHWADAESLDLIDELLAHPPPGLAVLVSARPEVEVMRPGWFEAAPPLAKPLVLTLGPLEDDDISRLLDDLLRFASEVPEALRTRVFEVCSGNPFHLEELIKMLIDDRVIQVGDPWIIDEARLLERKVPLTLTGVLQARLDLLPSDHFAVLQAASVVGRSFWSDVIQVVVDGPAFDAAAVERSLDALVHAEFIHRRPVSRFVGTDQFSFKHEYTRAVTYDTIGLQRRPRLHARAAAWLADAAGDRPDEQAIVIARHLDAAEDPLAAAAWFERAAQHARSQSAFVDAARLFGEAAQRYPRRRAERYRVLVDRADAQVVSGRFDEAKEEMAVLLLDDDAPISFAKRVRAHLARIASLRDADFTRAQELLAEALAIEADDGDEAAMDADDFVRHQLGTFRVVVGDYAGAVRCFEENLTSQSASRDPNRHGWGLNNLAHALAQDGRLERAAAIAAEAKAIAADLDDPRLDMAVRAQLGLIAVRTSDWETAQHHFEAAQEANRRNDDPEKLATVANYLGETAIELGQLDRAAAEFADVVEYSLRSNVVLELVRCIVGYADLLGHRGHVHAAARVLATAVAHESAGAEVRRYAETVAKRHGLPDDVDTVPGELADLARSLAGSGTHMIDDLDPEVVQPGGMP